MTNARALLVLVTVGSWSLPTCVSGQPSVESTPIPEPATPSTAVVAATVDGEPIHVEEVQKSMLTTLSGREVGPQMRPLLLAQMLEQLIERKLVHAYLERMDMGASDHEIDKKIEEYQAKLASQNRSLKDLLDERSLTERELRRRVTWELGWKKYVATHLSDAELEAYFNAHRHEFDGSQVRASHILLRSKQSGDSKATDKLVQRAVAIKKQILTGGKDFAESAKAYSVAPSSSRGGDVDYFPRHGIMVEAFSRAAFALEVGETSPPVVTRFGVHLIHLTDVKPGSKKWTDARGHLTKPTERHLFQKLASEQRENARIVFTGTAPYFKPGTREVVQPTQPRKRRKDSKKRGPIREKLTNPSE